MERYSALPGGSEPRHVTVSTTSVTAVVPTVIGVASGRLATSTVQPPGAVAATSGTGWSPGKRTSRLTVLAALSSFGTRKAKEAGCPAAASAGCTSTWAHAGRARPATAPVTA